MILFLAYVLLVVISFFGVLVFYPYEFSVSRVQSYGVYEEDSTVYYVRINPKTQRLEIDKENKLDWSLVAAFLILFPLYALYLICKTLIYLWYWCLNNTFVGIIHFIETTHSNCFEKRNG
jgi:hypothetical protein